MLESIPSVSMRGSAAATAACSALHRAGRHLRLLGFLRRLSPHPYTTSFQGFRSSRERNLRASDCLTVHFASSQSTRSLLRRETLASRHVAVDRLQISISAFGFLRVFMQSRKFAQWAPF